MNLLTDLWPWYIGGPIMGLSVLLMIYTTGRQFGISLSLKAACGLAAEKLFKSRPFADYSWQDDRWRLFYVGGIIAGGFIGSILLGASHGPDIASATIAHLSDAGIRDFSGINPSEIFGPEAFHSFPVMIYLFVGGIFIGFGSRYANGCSSGHAIMGLSYFQLASLVAAVSFMVGGILMANFLLPWVLKNLVLI